MGECENDSTLQTEQTIDPGPGDQEAWSHFIEQFARCGVVTEAACAANLGRSTVYEWKNRSARCALEWAEAEERANDVLRTEARRRAIEGVDKPLTFQGEIFAYERVYSDTLMGRLLQAHCPEHKQESSVNIGGQRGNALTVLGASLNVEGLSSEKRDQLEALIIEGIVAHCESQRDEDEDTEEDS